MNKYLFMIILGILIYSFINNKDGFSVGSIGWAILKDRADNQSQNPEDYDFYYNPLFDGDDIRNNFPDARQIYTFDIDDTGKTIEPINYNTTTDDIVNFGTLQFQYYAGNRDHSYDMTAACSVEFDINRILQRKVNEIFIRILMVYRRLKNIEDRPSFYEEGKMPFKRAILHTIKNPNIPLFYTASRFYYTVANLVRNGNINDLTINEPPDDATISSMTSIFSPGSMDSSISSSVIAFSTCLYVNLNRDVVETATSLYFNPGQEIGSDLSDEQIRTFIKSHIPDTTIESDRTRIEGVIDSIPLHNLKTRVFILLKPRDITNMEDFFENNVRITWKYGVMSQRTTSQAIINSNQQISETPPQMDSTQGRLLYRYSRWEAIVFLSDMQTETLALF
tara:strand:+ start:1431 stop:2609 length:1179 start_codon:yes stop_codon:yes gene_type:complete